MDCSCLPPPEKIAHAGQLKKHMMALIVSVDAAHLWEGIGRVMRNECAYMDAY